MKYTAIINSVFLENRPKFYYLLLSLELKLKHDISANEIDELRDDFRSTILRFITNISLAMA